MSKYRQFELKCCLLVDDDIHLERSILGSILKEEGGFFEGEEKVGDSCLGGGDDDISGDDDMGGPNGGEESISVSHKDTGKHLSLKLYVHVYLQRFFGFLMGGEDGLGSLVMPKDVSAFCTAAYESSS
jgi:hypothetical protein